jgi:hypothetical protein
MLSLLDKLNKNGLLVSNKVDKGVARHSGQIQPSMVPLGTTSNNGYGTKNDQIIFLGPRLL